MLPDTFRCSAIVENLDQAIAFVEGHADGFDLDTKKKFGLLVAVEEAFVNICHYAYSSSQGEVSLACKMTGGEFVVEIADTGSPFDILSLPAPDTTADIMDRQIGGLGVFFIRKLTDEASYRREDDKNILRMLIRQSQDNLHDI